MHKKISDFPAIHYLSIVLLRSVATRRYLKLITLCLHYSSATTCAFKFQMHLLHKFTVDSSLFPQKCPYDFMETLL